MVTAFFALVAFQLSQLFASTTIDLGTNDHLLNIGLTSDMSLEELTSQLRMLVVEEWRSDTANEYINFLPTDIDYFAEVAQFETSGVFSGPISDLMPLAAANLLGIPLAIVTSEPTNPLISVCPSRDIVSSTPIFLAYFAYGPGHYDAASLNAGEFLKS